MVRDVLSVIPDSNRKSLCKVAKAITAESANSTMLENLHSLERQGHMSRNLDPHCASLWATAVLSRPEEEMKFAINAALDTLPHNNNLHLWKKRKDSLCPLCKQNQTLLHVLNNCSYARDCRRYNKRHDAVLQEIVSTIRSKLPSSTELTTDIGTDYSFPLHIATTDLRPDVVWWDDAHKSLCLVELTVCFESNFEKAEQRKTVKYLDLVEQTKKSGYQATLLTLEVGSRGVPYYHSFAMLAKSINLNTKELNSLLHRVSTEALKESFKIWCSRNRMSEYSKS